MAGHSTAPTDTVTSFMYTAMASTEAMQIGFVRRGLRASQRLTDDQSRQASRPRIGAPLPVPIA